MVITRQNLLKPPFTFTFAQTLQVLEQSDQRHRIHHHQPKTSPNLHNHLNNLEQTEQSHAHIIETHINCTHFNSFAHYNLLISSYIRNNQPITALKIYACMRENGDRVDNFTVPTVLKACSLVQVAQLGKEIHGFAVRNGLDADVFVSNALIKMYAECGCMVSARLVFDEMPSRDVVSWSTMIGSYHKSRLFDEALNVVREMRFWRVRPSEVAVISMAGLFADIGDVEAGKVMHACVIRNSMSEKLGVAMATTLIDMYAKCGDIASAKRVFDGLDERRSVVSWTAMIAGCIRSNMFREGLRFFVEMLAENIFPTEITLRSLIIECGFVGGLELGKFLHAYILRYGCDLSSAVGTALVDMYGKCGEIRSARALFDSMENRDVMTWSAMISAYAQAHCSNKAFELFVQMKESAVQPNEMTIVTLLSLCSEAGALDMGKWIHAYTEKQGVEADVILETALVDMYAKCGDIDGAYRLFSAAKGRGDICMWNAMMGGYGMHGHCKEALELFADMERFGAKPNGITFIGLLNACSHAGLVEEGKLLFKNMVHDFRIVPKIEHYGCMVDLLGRAGLLDEAHEMIKSMPLRPNTIVWGALLAASKLHKNTNMGEVAARKLLEMEPHSWGYNALMSNIYAAENQWDDVARVRRAMEDIRVWKEPGRSSVEVVSKWFSLTRN